LKRHSNLEGLLRAMYPDFDWQSALFEGRAPPHFWKSKKNQIELIQRIGTKLGVTEVMTTED